MKFCPGNLVVARSFYSLWPTSLCNDNGDSIDGNPIRNIVSHYELLFIVATKMQCGVVEPSRLFVITSTGEMGWVILGAYYQSYDGKVINVIA